MSFSQLNFGQLLHELNNVDTKHKIRFYEKIKKRILLTNYGIYFNHIYIYIKYMDGLVREVNVRVLGKGLELLSANGGRFEINQLLFADDTALVADLEEKLCRLVSEFGRVSERKKSRVNVGKCKVMKFSRYGNGGRMHVRLNGESLEEVDCFKYLGSQVASAGRCEKDVIQIMY